MKSTDRYENLALVSHFKISKATLRYLKNVQYHRVDDWEERKAVDTKFLLFLSIISISSPVQYFKLNEQANYNNRKIIMDETCDYFEVHVL